MTTPDATFLEEVEDFLVSFDLPTFPTLHTQTDTESTEEASPTDAVKTEKPKIRGKRKKQVLDPVVKQELEKAKDRKRRSAYRERRKVEKETLQKQVGDLTTELTELQNAKRSLVSTAWEVVAKRQLQARVEAEEKQRRMVRAIESKAALIQKFQGFLQDNVGQKDLLDLDTVYQHKRIRLEPLDAEFYRGFAQQLDEFYAQTDEALKKCGLDSTDTSWESPRRQWKVDGEDGYYVYLDKYAMPFDFQQICRFTWQVAQMQHRQEDREDIDVEDPENTSAFKFRVTTRLNSGRSVSVLVRAVARRYVEDERSVIVWRSLTEGEGMFSGMHADEFGWCISVPLSNTTEPSTLMRTMIRHVPMHFSSAATQTTDVKQFTGFVLDTGTEDALEIGSRLENLLLQDK